MVEVRVGQEWEELQRPKTRPQRFVTVIGFDEDKVLLLCNGRKTKASRHRFNGRSGGYRLVCPPELGIS
jgi:hypothetical protein